LQIHGDGPVQLLVVECQPDLAFRATRSAWRCPHRCGAGMAAAGQCGRGRAAARSRLDPGKSPAAQQRYQVSSHCKDPAWPEALEAYLRQSEQIESRLWLAADQTSSKRDLLQRIAHPSSGSADQD